MNKRFLALGLVVTLGIGTIGCSKTKEEDSSQTQLREATVSTGTIREEISLSGSIQANKTTSVTSSSNSTVEDIYVEAGEEVSEGEDIILLENGKVIEAPYDGVITKISTSIDQDVTTSTALFSIADDSSYKVTASIDESEISKISHGQEVEVVISAANKELKGVISNVDAEATASGNSTSFGIVITIDNNDDEDTDSESEDNTNDFEGVYPGMSTEMNIIISESKDVLTVPIQAVKSSKGKKTVTVKNGDSTKEVEVQVGAQDSSYVEIKSGLNKGDVVVYEQAAKSQNQQGGFNPGNMMNFSGGEMPNFSSGERPQMPSGMQGGTPPQMRN